LLETGRQQGLEKKQSQGDEMAKRAAGSRAKKRSQHGKPPAARLEKTKPTELELLIEACAGRQAAPRRVKREVFEKKRFVEKL